MTTPMRTPENSTVTAEWVVYSLEKEGYNRVVAGLPVFKTVAAAVTAWLNRDKPGLFIYGGVGVGKTTVGKIAAKLFRRCWPHYKHRWGELQQQRGAKLFPLYREAAQKELRYYWPQEHEGDVVLLDDVGTESRIVDFGNVVDPVAAYAQSWWAAVSSGMDLPLIITTNLPPASIKTRYDERVQDRLRGSCIQLHIGGESHR